MILKIKDYLINHDFMNEKQFRVMCEDLGINKQYTYKEIRENILCQSVSEMSNIFKINRQSYYEKEKGKNKFNINEIKYICDEAHIELRNIKELNDQNDKY